MHKRYSVGMDKLTHLAALRAATRVAFGVVVVSGCSSAVTQEDAVYAESEINAAEPPCPEKADSGAPDTKPSCEAVLASAFPDGGAFSSFGNDPAPAVSDDVKTCCKDHLLSETIETWNLEHRWSCCSALGAFSAQAEDESIAIACTPWGPPVPPSMKRRSAMGVA